MLTKNYFNQGEIFPPLCELPRLKHYTDNYNLYQGEASTVLAPYEERFRRLIMDFESENVGHYFLETPNFWQLITQKTVDLMLGDKPIIKIGEYGKSQDDIKGVDELLDDIATDFDIYGEAIVQVYIDKNNEKAAVVKDPTMWFPIVNVENTKEITEHIIAWVVKTYTDPLSSAKDRYELFVQTFKVGGKGYELKRFNIDKVTYDLVIMPDTKENLGMQKRYKIGALLDESFIDNGITDSIIHFRGPNANKSIHGQSSYDRYTGTIAELSIRKSLRDYILDKNSTPRLAAPESAFIQGRSGAWELKTGGRNFIVGMGQPNPQYITWDGSIANIEIAINELKEELYTLSEMGVLISDDEINTSQGYEALRIKLTPALAKVQRMCRKFNEPTKKLVSKLLDVEIEKITIDWNNGLPPSITETLDQAQKAKDLGFSKKTILRDYFKFTEEMAEVEIEQANEENADAFANNFIRGGGDTL